MYQKINRLALNIFFLVYSQAQNKRGFLLCSVFNFSFRLSISIPNGWWILFEHCNRQGFGRFRVVFLQRWVVVDRLGFLPYHESSLSMIQLFQWTQLQQSLFFQWVSWRISAYLLSISGRGGRWILFGRCSQRGFFRFRVVFLQKPIFVGRLGCLLFRKFCFWDFLQFKWSPFGSVMVFPVRVLTKNCMVWYLIIDKWSMCGRLL